MISRYEADAKTEGNRGRFHGLMVGTAVGDALGRPVEGQHEVSEAYVEEILDGPASLIYTDDTAMTIWLTESLLASDGFDGADMAQRFAEGYAREPHRGYGRNIVDLFDRVLRGFDWEEAARVQFGGAGSYGNGAAMRVAPAALWAFPELDETIRLARLTAEVTHTHPVGVEGAVVQAVAAHHALSEQFDAVSLLEDLDRLVKTDQFRDKLEVLPKTLGQGDVHARLHLGNWVSADQSVITALYCFLASGDFEETIVRAIRIGGDTDTIAAMAGALAGARHGLESIPAKWRHVEGHDQLLELADRLADRVEKSS